MSQVDLTKFKNTLLTALPAGDLAMLQPLCVSVRLERKESLIRPGEPIKHVHFLQSGIASITQPSPDNGPTEIGLFGRDGMSGMCLLLGQDRSPHDTFIQVGSADAVRIAATPFVEAVEASETLRKLMLSFVQVMMVQTAQCAVANARHGIEARLARWLLICHDRSDGDEIALTHELLAIMIAAQRSGVTVALHVLEGMGMIRSRRGVVVIRDRAKLEELAGDGYGLAEAEYRRLIRPLGPSPR